MKSRFQRSLEQASEFRALLVLLVVLFLRARRIIPTLRPGHLLVPATIMQIAVLVIAAINSKLFIPIFAVGNFIVVGIMLAPFLMLQPKSTEHWVKGNE